MPELEQISGQTILPGHAAGRVLYLSEPLNVWGGLDPVTGRIVHEQHPQFGEQLTDRVLVLLETRGSGTNAQVLAEAWSNGVGPRAVVLGRFDSVLVTGAVVASELYGRTCPVCVVREDDLHLLAAVENVTVKADPEQALVEVSAQL